MQASCRRIRKRCHATALHTAQIAAQASKIAPNTPKLDQTRIPPLRMTRMTRMEGHLKQHHPAPFPPDPHSRNSRNSLFTPAMIPFSSISPHFSRFSSLLSPIFAIFGQFSPFFSLFFSFLAHFSRFSRPRWASARFVVENAGNS